METSREHPIERHWDEACLAGKAKSLPKPMIDASELVRPAVIG
jgi:hypothetical protein